MTHLTSPVAWPAGPRLRLREFASSDAAEVAAMHRDPRVRAQLVDDHPLHEPAVAQGFVAGMQDFYRRHEGTGIWCAERAVPPDADSVAEARAAHAAGEIGDALLASVQAPGWHFAGWFSLVHLSDAPHELEIGARLRPEAWGGTLALDGGDWLLARAFDVLGRPRVWGHCDPANRSAAHCLRVLGFSASGTARYNGQQAARFVLERAHWASWRQWPRRDRLRRVRESR
jgi:RimJ/RimL family protein N-acetyltransferase